MPYKIFTETPCTEEFSDIMVHAATITCTCDACGRVHFDTAGHDYEDGDLEELCNNQEKEPEKYIGGEGSVPYFHYLGLQIVTTCPCNYARIIEKEWLRSCKDMLRYFKAQATKQRDAGQTILDLIDEIDLPT